MIVYSFTGIRSAGSYTQYIYTLREWKGFKVNVISFKLLHYSLYSLYGTLTLKVTGLGSLTFLYTSIR
ncbi:hypothetical protein NEUTE2DRAFT_129422 [Neurospora tetrasperma FGSC 2509]|nr:hypothetical protein NEUTE2DRAFT_129422 [Neurospora tetrasperma FGSC 2509]